MKIRVGSGFLIFGVYLAAGGYRYMDLSIIPAVLLHEAGHIAAALLLQVKITRISLEPFGARIEIAGSLVSYEREAAVAAAGPAASIAAAGIAALFCLSGGFDVPYLQADFTARFAACSLFLGLLNLVPVRTFDGGRILYSLLAKMSGMKTADGSLKITTAVAAFLVWFLSVYLLIKYRSGLSLFAVSLVMLMQLAVP